MDKGNKQFCRLAAASGSSRNRGCFPVLRGVLLPLISVCILAGSVGCGRESGDTLEEPGRITTGAALHVSSQENLENIQQQLEVLAENAGQWRSARDASANQGYNEIYYLITDLDQNGRLEVMGHESLGWEEKEISLGCYEVNSAGNGIVEVETASLGGTYVEDFYDVGDGLYTAYYDPKTGEYHYVTDSRKVFTLKQGKLSRESVSDTVCAAWEKMTARIPCFSFYHNWKDTTEEQMLHTMEMAYRDFSIGYPLGQKEMTVSGRKIMIPQYSTMQDREKQEKINRLIYEQVSRSLETAFDLDHKGNLEELSVSVKYAGRDRVSLLLMASGSRKGMDHAQTLCDTVNIDLKQECILSGQSILPERYREEVEEDIQSGDCWEILSGKDTEYPLSFQKQNVKIYQSKDRIGLVIPTGVEASPYVVYEVYVDMEQRWYNGFPDSIPYPDVDWEAYRYTLLASEYQSLQDYMSVLLGKTNFTWTQESYTEQEEETVKLEEVSIYQFIEQYYGEPAENYRDYHLGNISVSDVTQDGKPELVLHFSSYGGFYLILHQEGKQFYGTDRSERCFQGLQKNGVYQASGGFDAQYFYQMRFREGKFVESMIAQQDGKKYYIGNKKVNEKEFGKWVDDNIGEMVCQYEPEELQESGESGQ